MNLFGHPDIDFPACFLAICCNKDWKIRCGQVRIKPSSLLQDLVPQINPRADVAQTHVITFKQRVQVQKDASVSNCTC